MHFRSTRISCCLFLLFFIDSPVSRYNRVSSPVSFASWDFTSAFLPRLTHLHCQYVTHISKYTHPYSFYSIVVLLAVMIMPPPQLSLSLANMSLLPPPNYVVVSR